MSHHAHPASRPSHTNGPSTPPGLHRSDAVAASSEAIAARAYEKFVARGRVHGFDQEDWGAAQRELLAEASGRS
jgi:Protein of unknown function (DUF2934)